MDWIRKVSLKMKLQHNFLLVSILASHLASLQRYLALVEPETAPEAVRSGPAMETKNTGWNLPYRVNAS